MTQPAAPGGRSPAPEGENRAGKRGDGAAVEKKAPRSGTARDGEWALRLNIERRRWLVLTRGVLIKKKAAGSAFGRR